MPSKRVLVIDTENDIEAEFCDDGSYIISTASGHDGVTKARQLQPDVILVGMLSDLQDYEINEMLQSSYTTQSIPVVPLTAKIRAYLRTYGMKYQFFLEGIAPPDEEVNGRVLAFSA